MEAVVISGNSAGRARGCHRANFQGFLLFKVQIRSYQIINYQENKCMQIFQGGKTGKTFYLKAALLYSKTQDHVEMFCISQFC